MDFVKKTLGDLTVGKGQYGIGASAVDYSEDLYTYLRITDINDDGTLNVNNLKSINDKNAERYLLQPNDIVFARTGNSTGRNYFYDGTDGILVYAGFLIKFSIDSSKVNPKYIKYYCMSDEYKGWVQGHLTGSTRGNINAQTYANMEISIPPREQQNRIVSILEELERKRKNNIAINRNLSEQAQAIYESWFVSFKKFGGMVPLDWGEGVLGDIAEIKTTTFKPDKEPDVIVEHYSIPALDENHFPIFELAEGIKSNKYLLNKNSVMISKLNPDIKRIWRPMCLSDRPVCSTEFIVFEAKNKKNKDFIFSILDSDNFSNHLCSHVTGSTGSRQRAVPKATLDFKVLIPPSEVIEQFCSMVTPIYDLIGVNEIENQRLSELRDSLLPKLMSGELDVSDLDI